MTAGLLAARLAAAERPRHLLLAAVVAGLICGPLPPPAMLGGAVLAAAVPASPVLGAAAGTTVLGAGLAGAARTRAVDDGPAAALHGLPAAGTAVVLEPPRRRRHGSTVARVRLQAGPAAGDVAVLRARGPVRWPPVGGVVAFRGRAGPVEGPEAWQARRGAHALIDAAEVRPTGERRGGLSGALDGVRERGLAALASEDAPVDGALLRGMVLGDDSDVPEDVREAFERTSLAHLLAVSGQNVVLLATLVMAAAAAAGGGRRSRLALALGAVAAYVPLTGAGASIQRAGVMGCAGLLAAMAGRPGSRWYAVGLAAAATLAWNPHAVEDVGWQLSFAAVVALLVAVPPLRAGLRRRRVPAVLADPLAVTAAATLGTAPLLALRLDQVSTVALPANLLAAPAVAPLMWLGMVAAGLAQVAGVLAGPPAALAVALTAYVRTVAGWMDRVPHAAVTPGPLLTAGVTAACLAALGLLAAGPERLRRLDPRRARVASPRPAAPPARAVLAAVLATVGVVGAILIAGRTGPAPPAPGELVVSFLDVGQGDATLLRRDGAAVLVDTGPPDGPVIRRLAAERVRRLDVLLLTHAQADHEGAALDVIRVYRPRLVLNGGDGRPSRVQSGLREAAAAVGARIVETHAGHVIGLGGMRLRVLWPTPRPAGVAPAGDPNERAVVTHLRAGAFDLLLPADAESAVTGGLALPRVEALKVAHHGSADDGLGRLLARVRPSVAAIPVGRRNSYGHPAPSTLDALRAVPHVLRTDRDGTIRLRVRATRMTVERAGSAR